MGLPEWISNNFQEDHQNVIFISAIMAFLQKSSKACLLITSKEALNCHFYCFDDGISSDIFRSLRLGNTSGSSKCVYFFFNVLQVFRRISQYS